MTIHLLQIPSDPANWAAWLEDYFSGDRLGELVHELNLVRNADQTSTTTSSLTDIVNQEQLDSVRQSGLAALQTTQVQQLIANPESLLDLQEFLLLQGGDSWDVKLRTSELQKPADSIRRQIVSEIGPPALSATGLGDSTQEIQPARSRRGILGVLVTALAAVVCVLFWPSAEYSGSGRILGQAGLVKNDVSSSTAYLNRIADAGATWFDERPANSKELAVLLSEVSHDCQVLIDAPHEALSATEREWFVTKCQNWKNKFDETLADLNADAISFAEAKSAADATMTKLVDVLRAGPTA